MSVLTITSLAFTGEHRGVSISYTQGSTLRCYRMERTAIGKEPIEEYLGHTGVYVLYNETDVYVGEATNVFNRLKSHNKTKDFWTDVLCFTTIDHSIDQGDAKYLEARLIKMANAAGRYNVHNSKEETVHKSTEIKRLTRESLLQLIVQFGEFFNMQISVPAEATAAPVEESVVTITPTATVTETVTEPAPTPVQELKVTDLVLTSPHYTLYENARVAIDNMKPLPLDILRDQLKHVTVTEDSKVLVLNSMEHAFALSQCYGVPHENITIQTANPAFARIAVKAKFKVYNATNLLDCPDMKFDIVIGNPPYQEDNGKSVGGKSIWHKFVSLAFDSCKDGGYVSLVHPGSWRGGSGMFKEVKSLLTKYNTSYINMNSKPQGEKVFGAGTSFDYYVSQKVITDNDTILVGFDKDETLTTNLKDWGYVPASQFNLGRKLIAKAGQEKQELLHDWAAYDSRTLKEEQSAEYCHPILYRLRQDGPRIMYTNTTEPGHFGVSKVVMCTGGTSVINDKEGKYGLSQFCYAFVCEPDECDDLYNFITSLEVKAFFKENQTGIDFYDRKILANFVKDFWK